MESDPENICRTLGVHLQDAINLIKDILEIEKIATAPKGKGVVRCFHRRDGEAAGCEIYAAERQRRLREKKEGGDNVALP